MAKKKLIMSATLSTAVATMLIGADEAQAETYNVKSGDSLWAIAHQFDTSVPSLKSINNLSGNIIFPNQVLQTSSTNDTQTESKPDTKPSTDKSETKTYTVKSGDTLSGIASKHNISLSKLMKWNDLDSTLIFPGNQFTVSKQTQAGNPSTNQPKEDTPTTDSGDNASKQYVVKSGDTLSFIAQRYNVTVRNLKQWNHLNTSLILIGQKLSINGQPGDTPTNDTTVEDTPPSNIDYNINKLISVASGLKGTPYVWGGASPSGFDCSGFIHYTYKQAGKDLSRLSTDGYYNRSYDIRKPKKGDLVFFKNTYRSGISHMGIYLGNDEFIHAGSRGVEITNVNYDYWQDHFDGYKRLY